MGDRLDVRTVAQGRWPTILMALGVDERALSGKHCACPLGGGRDRFRFDDKEGRGTYFCSGCGAGDGVNLVMGITGQSFRDVAQRIEQIASVVQPSGIKPGRTDEDKLAALRRVYTESAPIADGDHAVQYLRARGLTLCDLPLSVRTHPRLAYHDNGVKVGDFPAMVATVTDQSGKAVSIHRTYLQDGKKAPITAPKKLMRGLPIAGAAIRLTPVSECLGIAEGIETALAASELFGVPVWSCLSTSGIKSFEPPPGTRKVIIFGDNDTNCAGQAAAWEASHRLALREIEVEVQIPDQVGDWLDVLVRKGNSAVSSEPTKYGSPSC